MRLSAGSILSEGDDAINGPEARALGPTGAGVSVGIISDSMTSATGGIANSVGTRDLPPDTVALSDRPDGTGEGRAMAEILYDEAPGVSRIRFATADGGPAAKANAIDALVADGARVIADDTSYVTEPFFQDDVIAQAVDRAKAAGVAYFIAAGNDAQHGWGAAFSPVADPSPAHSAGTEDFDHGPGVDTTQTIGTFHADESVDLVLQWAEPWGAAASDFALDVYDVADATHTPLTFDTNNLATGIPMEWAPIKFTGTATIEVAIRRVSGAGAPPLKLVAFSNGAGNVAIEHAADGGAIDPDAASAKGALTVAASNFATPTVPETYSSRGPVTHFFDARGTRLATPEMRQKPDLAGPDGVKTSVPGFSPFPGTSAAAPAAAGIAALIRSAKPAMPVDELYAIMTSPSNAVDCPAPGNPDIECGAGFLLADSAMEMALDSTAPAITASLSPAAPDTASGWYREPVGVSWQVSDPESPVVDPAGCEAVSLTTSASLTCRATSAGGTTAAPLSVKIDPTAPSQPAFTGIRARTYLPATLPSSRAIKCSSGDPTSGVVGCNVSGYRSRLGAHVLTATATNGAGLTATSTLAYTVAKPAAISKLELTRLGLARLRSSGLKLTVRVAAASTRLGRQARGARTHGIRRRNPRRQHRNARQAGVRGHGDAARRVDGRGQGAAERAHEDDAEDHDRRQRRAKSAHLRLAPRPALEGRSPDRSARNAQILGRVPFASAERGERSPDPPAPLVQESARTRRKAMDALSFGVHEGDGTSEQTRLPFLLAGRTHVQIVTGTHPRG